MLKQLPIVNKERLQYDEGKGKIQGKNNSIDEYNYDSMMRNYLWNSFEGYKYKDQIDET